ncbi:MAG: hypothetical protein M3P06_23465 [Acidobacteriota bacterium]|nr:hypothetical protein [Acidobacteriota bacterium]
MSKSEHPPQPYVQVAVFHDSDTGNRVAVSLLWVTTIQETDTDTVFTFLNGSTQSVRSGFDAVADAFVATVPKERRPR